MTDPATLTFGVLSAVGLISGYGAMTMNAQQSKEIRDIVNAQCKANDMLLNETRKAKDFAQEAKLTAEQEVEKLKREVDELEREKAALTTQKDLLNAKIEAITPPSTGFLPSLFSTAAAPPVAPVAPPVAPPVPAVAPPVAPPVPAVAPHVAAVAPPVPAVAIPSEQTPIERDPTSIAVRDALGLPETPTPPSPPPDDVASVYDDGAGTGLTTPVASDDPTVSEPEPAVPDTTQRVEDLDRAIQRRSDDIASAIATIRIFNKTGRKASSTRESAMSLLKTPLDTQELLRELSGSDVDERVQRLAAIEKTAADAALQEETTAATPEGKLANAERTLAAATTGSELRRARDEVDFLKAKLAESVRTRGGTRRTTDMRKKKLRTRRGIQQNVRRTRSGKNRADRTSANPRRGA